MTPPQEISADAPDMEYAHPGAPDRHTTRSMLDLYAQPGALSMEIERQPGAYDLRTVEQRHHDEITALTRQMRQISQLTITLAGDLRRLKDAVADDATRIAELSARLDAQEATD